MKKKNRTRRPMAWLFAVLGVALVVAIVWGVYSGLRRLVHYSENVTISAPEASASEEQIQEEEEILDEVEPLARNTYNPDGFYEKDGILFYHGGDIEGVAGVDVSSYQEDIDWEAVRDAGISFAMVRVGYRGYSTGVLDLDNCFQEHIEGAAAAGLDVGVYFFSQALTPEEAKEEAEYVLEQIKDYDIQYPVVFDWEEMHVEARTDEMNMLLLTACAQAFCETIAQAGYTPGVYFNQAYGYGQLNLVSLQDYVFWLAEYADAPTFAYHFELWQYTNEGRVPGINGNVDLNIAFRKKTAGG